MTAKERPIVFGADSVCSTLDGRKTQHRVAAKPQPELIRYCKKCGLSDRVGCELPDCEFCEPVPLLKIENCPHGQPGDRLWVRETWHYARLNEDNAPCILYRADKGIKRIENDVIPDECWRPSTHMPRWAARILLEITDIRVERLQAINGVEAKREGMPVPAHLPEDGADLDHARRAFQKYWESANGPGSWDANPWVWALSFRRVG